MLIVTDAGPLLSFARADHLDLLRDIVGTLIIPEAVYEEIVVRGAGKPGADAVRQAVWLTRATVTDRTFVDQLPSNLHVGEREALALARNRGGVVLQVASCLNFCDNSRYRGDWMQGGRIWQLQ